MSDSVSKTTMPQIIPAGTLSNTEVVRQRLADGRTIADYQIRDLLNEIDRLNAFVEWVHLYTNDPDIALRQQSILG